MPVKGPTGVSYKQIAHQEVVRWINAEPNTYAIESRLFQRPRGFDTEDKAYMSNALGNAKKIIVEISHLYLTKVLG